MGKKEDGLWTGTLVFAIAYVVAAVVLGEYVRSRTKDRSQAGDNRKLTWGLTFLGAVCCWSLWICTYMHQMYPLIKPDIEGHA